jgi:hypothetical protein
MNTFTNRPSWRSARSQWSFQKLKPFAVDSQMITVPGTSGTAFNNASALRASGQNAISEQCRKWIGLPAAALHLLRRVDVRAASSGHGPARRVDRARSPHHTSSGPPSSAGTRSAA